MFIDLRLHVDLIDWLIRRGIEPGGAHPDDTGW
jgi:hypothetical protein